MGDFHNKMEENINNKVVIKPKRGDIVWVWCDDLIYKKTAIFLAEIPGANNPIVCVRSGDESKFHNDQKFSYLCYDNMEATYPELLEIDSQINELEKRKAAIIGDLDMKHLLNRLKRDSKMSLQEILDVFGKETD